MIGAPEILTLLVLLVVAGGPVIAVLVIWNYVLRRRFRDEAAGVSFCFSAD